MQHRESFVFIRATQELRKYQTTASFPKGICQFERELKHMLFIVISISQHFV